MHFLIVMPTAATKAWETEARKYFVFDWPIIWFWHKVSFLFPLLAVSFFYTRGAAAVSQRFFYRIFFSKQMNYDYWSRHTCDGDGGPYGVLLENETQCMVWSKTCHSCLSDQADICGACSICSRKEWKLGFSPKLSFEAWSAVISDSHNWFIG